MKYLKIQNKGLLDVRLLKLIGASTKTSDSNKIGQFGTGLKYAISYLLRTTNNFKVFIGEEEVMFVTEPVNIKGISAEEIFCNGDSMNITTEYGYQWNAWEILREIWCNAIDEEDASAKAIDGRSKLKGKAGATTFYIEMDEDIQKVHDKWNLYFNAEVPIFQNNKFSIYKKVKHNSLKVYKNNVLVDGKSHYNSYFNYDFKDCELNELRQYRGFINGDIPTAILNSNRKIVKQYLEMYNNSEVSNVIEKSSLYFSSADYEPKIVKELFQGYLFLHPESNKEAKDRAVYVPMELYTILEKCELPCEKITTRSGQGYYGSSGSGYNESKLIYKEVANPELQKRINKILNKYDKVCDFSIAVSLKGDFEIIPDVKELIFNTNIDVLSDKDLESVVLIGLLHNRNSNMYNIMKRLMKIVLRSKNFRRILFT